MNSSAETLPRRHRITVEEYHRMGEAGILAEDDRVELIDGEIIDMTPIGTRHAACVSQLNRVFVRGTNALVRIQDPIRLGNHSEPQPDLALVKPRRDRYARAHPAPDDVLLLIEVADTSSSYDRSVKIPLYARHGIPEVWLVDLTGDIVEAFRQPSPSGYQQVRRHRKGASLKPLLVPEVEVDLGELLGAY